jgi:hypothetical protein
MAGSRVSSPLPSVLRWCRAGRSRDEGRPDVRVGSLARAGATRQASSEGTVGHQTG